jgi:hypothetical protein
MSNKFNESEGSNKFLSLENEELDEIGSINQRINLPHFIEQTKQLITVDYILSKSDHKENRYNSRLTQSQHTSNYFC